MKGGIGTGKRKWRCLVIAVLFLVFLSMLVPLAFLLGLHNAFRSTPAFVSVQVRSISSGIRNLDRYGIRSSPNQSKGDGVDQIIEDEPKIAKLKPTFPKKKVPSEASAGTISQNPTLKGPPKIEMVPHNVSVQSSLHANHPVAGGTLKTTQPGTGDVDGTGILCELRYGSYCLWLEEHKEKINDDMIKKLKDQLFVARAYYPSIAKIPSQNKLTLEFKQNIQELERILGESTTDSDLPPLVVQKLKKVESIVARATAFPIDLNNVEKKLRQLFDMTEDEADFHMKQSAFLYQLAVQTMPKSHHCLSMKLTVEYFKSFSPDMEPSVTEKLSDPSLHHYIIISNSLLAATVVINSTVFHARESQKCVFHLLTDQENYFSMKFWFFKNTYKQAAVQVLNIEELNLDYHERAAPLSLPVEFRVSLQNVNTSLLNRNTMHYLSLFSYTNYLLPEIFPELKRVVILEDDAVVQQDLSTLWSLNMEGKVNGAVQSCSVRLGQLKHNLGGATFNKNACSWMSGLNIIDLARWRELDLSEKFWTFASKMRKTEESAEVVGLYASLLTFQDLIYPLDPKWMLSGLGHDYKINIEAANNAAVLHYNGNAKPWLEIGIPKYKPFWNKYLNQEDHYLSECNVNS